MSNDTKRTAASHSGAATSNKVADPRTETLTLSSQRSPRFGSPSFSQVTSTSSSSRRSRFKISSSEASKLRSDDTSIFSETAVYALSSTGDYSGTVIRVSQKAAALGLFGPDLGYLSSLASSNLAVGVGVTEAAIGLPLIALYLAWKDNLHKEYNNNPFLLSCFLQEFFKAHAASTPTTVEAFEAQLEKICEELQSHLDLAYDSDPALKAKYQRVQLQYSVENGEYIFHLTLKDKEQPKPQQQPKCALVLAKDERDFAQKRPNRAPCYILTPTNLFYFDAQRELQQLFDAPNATDKLKQLKTTLGVANESLAGTSTHRTLKKELSYNEFAAITAATGHCQIPCELFFSDPPFSTATIREKIKTTNVYVLGDNYLLFFQSGASDAVRLRLQRAQVKAIRELGQGKLNPQQLQSITAITGHSQQPESSKSSSFEEYLAKKGRSPWKQILNFSQHLSSALVLVFVLSFIAWIVGTLLTNSDALVTPGNFGLAALFNVAIPLAIANLIFGRRMFHWLEQRRMVPAWLSRIVHYQFYKESCNVHHMTNAPLDADLADKIGSYIWVATEDKLYYVKEDGVKEQVPLVDPALFKTAFESLSKAPNTTTSLNADQIQRWITSNGGHTPKGKGFFQFCVNGFISLLLSPFCLNPITLIVTSFTSPKKPKENTLSAEKHTDIATLTRGAHIFEQYRRANEQTRQACNKHGIPFELPELPNRITNIDDIPDHEPPLTGWQKVKKLGAAMRTFWLLGLAKTAFFEFVAFFVMIFIQYAGNNSDGATNIVNAMSTSTPVAWVFIGIGLVFAIWKTWEGLNQEALDQRKTNNRTARRQEAILRAEINRLQEKLIDIQAETAALEMQNPGWEKVEELQKPIIPDATNHSNLSHLKNPAVKESAIEKLISFSPFAAFAFIAMNFLDSFFPARMLFWDSTGISSRLFADLFNAILKPFNISLSTLSGSVFGSLLLGYAIFHAYLRISERKKDQNVAKLKAERQTMPLQREALTREVSVHHARLLLMRQAPSIINANAAARPSEPLTAKIEQDQTPIPAKKDTEEKRAASTAPLLTAKITTPTATTTTAADYSYNNLYPDPDNSSRTSQKNNQQKRVYFLAWLALTSIFTLLIVSLTPSLFELLPMHLLWPIELGLVSVALWNLWRYDDSYQALLTKRERANIVAFAVSLLVSAILVAFEINLPGAHSLIVPVFTALMAILFAVTTQTGTNSFSYAKVFLNSELINILHFQQKIKYLNPTEAKKLEFVVDAMLGALNPRNKGAYLMYESEKQQLSVFKHLQRIREVLRGPLPTLHSIDRDTLYVFTRIIAKNNDKSFKPYISTETSSDQKGRVDYYCFMFIFVLALLGILLPSALSAGPIAEHLLASVIPCFFCLKLIVDNINLRKNHLGKIITNIDNRIYARAFAGIVLTLLLVGTTSLYIIPFQFNFPLPVQIFLPAAATILLPILLKLLADAAKSHVDGGKKIQSLISKALSPRRLTQGILVLLLVGCGIGFSASLVMMLLFNTSLFELGCIAASCFTAFLMLAKLIEIVFDYRDQKTAPKTFLAAVVSHKAIAWSRVLILSLLAFIAIPAFSTLFLLHIPVPAISQTATLLITLSALPLAFLIIKEFLPNALIQLRVNKTGTPEAIQQHKERIQTGCRVTAYVAVFAILGVAIGTTGFLSTFTLITGISLAGSMIGEVIRKHILSTGKNLTPTEFLQSKPSPKSPRRPGRVLYIDTDLTASPNDCDNETITMKAPPSSPPPVSPTSPSNFGFSAHTVSSSSPASSSSPSISSSQEGLSGFLQKLKRHQMLLETKGNSHNNEPNAPPSSPLLKKPRSSPSHGSSTTLSSSSAPLNSPSVGSPRTGSYTPSSRNPLSPSYSSSSASLGSPSVGSPQARRNEAKPKARSFSRLGKGKTAIASQNQSAFSLPAAAQATTHSTTNAGKASTASPNNPSSSTTTTRNASLFTPLAAPPKTTRNNPKKHPSRTPGVGFHSARSTAPSKAASYQTSGSTALNQSKN